MRHKKAGMTRRRFVGATAAGLAGISIVPWRVLGGAAERPPSEKLNIAAIGVGGQGATDVGGLAGENLVALCDADLRPSKETFKKFPQARQYRDFRQMLDEMDKQIDAVLVATPDHTHAVAAMAAIKRGKHVYCEKPLAHSVWEVRQLMKAAGAAKVVTQLGNQGHSSDGIRGFCEWIWDGAIGQVHTIHAGCEQFGHAYSKVKDLAKLKEKHEVPPELDWDLWLGPAAERPYHPAYLPFQWRGWTDFGTGVLGDWCCHVLDPSFWALDLGSPSTVTAEKVVDWDPQKDTLTFPPGYVIRYEFAKTDKHGPITLYWHAGTERVPRVEGLDPGVPPPGTGAIVMGDKGLITHSSHGAGGAQIYPEARRKEFKPSPPRLPRVKGHAQDWLDAIRSGTKAGSDWSYGGPLTELGLLGVLALRFPGQELKYDGPTMRFTNSDQATKLLTPKYREGWTL
jgi:predicted dehydrogenase